MKFLYHGPNLIDMTLFPNKLCAIVYIGATFFVDFVHFVLEISTICGTKVRY